MDSYSVASLLSSISQTVCHSVCEVSEIQISLPTTVGWRFGKNTKVVLIKFSFFLMYRLLLIPYTAQYKNHIVNMSNFMIIFLTS